MGQLEGSPSCSLAGPYSFNIQHRLTQSGTVAPPISHSYTSFICAVTCGQVKRSSTSARPLRPGGRRSEV